MKINSLLSDLIITTSYAPWDIGKEDIAVLNELLGKAQKLNSISPTVSIRTIKLIFELKALYSDIARESIEKDADIAFLFKLLNSTLSAAKETDVEKATLLISQAQKFEMTIKTKKETTSSFVKSLKYDSIYLQLSRLIKTAGEVAIFLAQEKL